MNAYNHYVKEKMVEYKSLYADWPHKMIMKNISMDWKKLADKRRYQEMAKKSKEDYEKIKDKVK